MDTLKSKITATSTPHKQPPKPTNPWPPTNKKTLAEMQNNMRGQWHYLHEHLPHLKMTLKWVASLRALQNLPMWNFCRRMWHAFRLAQKGDPTWWIWLKVKLTNWMPVHISVLMRWVPLFPPACGKEMQLISSYLFPHPRRISISKVLRNLYTLFFFLFQRLRKISG